MQTKLKRDIFIKSDDVDVTQKIVFEKQKPKARTFFSLHNPLTYPLFVIQPPPIRAAEVVVAVASGIRSLVSSVTRCGDFESSYLQILGSKVPQIFENFLGYFKKHYVLSKTYRASFLGNLCQLWTTFYSNIWSHFWRGTIRQWRKVN